MLNYFQSTHVTTSMIQFVFQISQRIEISGHRTCTLESQSFLIKTLDLPVFSQMFLRFMKGDYTIK